MQDVAGVQLVAGSFFAGLAGSLYTGPGDVSWRPSSSIRLGVFGALWGYFTAGSCSSLVLGSVSTKSGGFVLFGSVLWQVLIHPRYLSLYQQTLETLMLFGAVLPQEGSLVHHLSHRSLYQ